MRIEVVPPPAALAPFDDPPAGSPSSLGRDDRDGSTIAAGGAAGGAAAEQEAEAEVAAATEVEEAEEAATEQARALVPVPVVAAVCDLSARGVLGCGSARSVSAAAAVPLAGGAGGHSDAVHVIILVYAAAESSGPLTHNQRLIILTGTLVQKSLLYTTSSHLRRGVDGRACVRVSPSWLPSHRACVCHRRRVQVE